MGPGSDMIDQAAFAEFGIAVVAVADVEQRVPCPRCGGLMPARHVTGCPLYPVRPVSKFSIPESTLDYYGITGPERDRYTLKRALNGRFSDQTGNERHHGINRRADHSTVAS